MDELLTYVTEVAHIGIAVPNIALAQKQYELLGFRALHEDVHREEAQQVQAKMMSNGAYTIELLSPLDEGSASPVDSYMSQKCYNMYHIAYYVSDLEAQMRVLGQNRFIPVSEPHLSAVTGKRSVFMFHRKMGILELTEE